MKSSSSRLPSKSILAASIFIITAVFLFAAAFMEPKHSEPGEWVPVNDAAGEAIMEIEKADTGNGALQITGEKAAGLVDDKGDLPRDPADKMDNHALPEKQFDSESVTSGSEDISPIAATDPAAEENETGKLDINRATAPELDALKGIGPAKAQAIVQDREKNGKYASIDDLLRVKGIGEKLLNAMQDSIVARP
ncbi:ComEA family DNA-binding protein [Paenibacillus sp. LHD-38]|uniref:ComEA family DNA-binding protein n=1 Tax=Paenibacillus sp. LHD-38 TaxID=3072143 RepID=UPI00280DD948|nr:ComEA family DNA-binding protein [Paenibacillus sp. LHD-38]MDQ8736747.1 ComEA family DNA-binding protein [Paenibacillus sp. LHD-38]